MAGLLLCAFAPATRAADLPSTADPAAAQLTLVGKPVVGKNADGRLEVFKVDTDGEVRHRWQKASNGDWSSWSGLGGSFLPGIALATNSEGQLEVFALDQASHALWHAHQLAANSTDWSSWSSLGGSLRPPVALGQDKDGRLEVFAVEAARGRVQHLWQTNSEGGWSSWAEMEAQAEPGLVAVRRRDARLEVFGIEPAQHALVHCWQAEPGSSEHWSPWAGLGGDLVPGFAVGQNILGRLEVFAVNRTNAALQRICQAAPGDSLHWTAWQDFGGSQTIGPPMQLPSTGADASSLVELPGGSADLEHPDVSAVRPGLAVGQSADGRLEVFAVAAGDSALLHRWERLIDGSDNWSRWAGLGVAARPDPAVVQNEDGDLEVFALDVHDTAIINHRRQISHARDWLDWSSLDQPAFQCSSRTWQTDEGLPHNVVQALAQTRDGYLWVGTQAGLARFDGVAFTTCDPETAPWLKGTSISALCADHNGALWIGAEGNGLLCFTGGQFKHYGKAEGLAGENIEVIYQSKDGALWLGTTTGMSRFKDGKFLNYTKNQGLLSEVVRAIYEDRSGNLWIATGAGLNRLGPDGMAAFAMPNGLPNDSVRCICQDRGGRVWIGSNNGMLWYSWFWKIFYAYNTRYGLSDTFVSAICEDREGNLWVGTYSGLNRFREGKFINQLDNEGVPFGKVNALLEDHEGNLWVGSREGLVRLTPKRFFTYTKRQGLTHNNVTSVLEDRAGSLWVGTWGGGLNRLKDEHVTAYAPTNVASTNALSQALVLSLCQTHDDGLWVGADFDGGLARFKDGQFTHYTTKDGLLGAPVRLIHQDHAGNLWLGTSRGLSRFKDGKFAHYTARDGLAGEEVRAVCEDAQGNLWFGTENGLSRWNPTTERFTNFTTQQGLSDNTITALYEDTDHDLWIGTAAGGLNRLRLEESPNSKVPSPKSELAHDSPGEFTHHASRITSYTSRQGLFSDEILEILEDDFGCLWMSCSRGVFRVRKLDLDQLDRGTLLNVASLAYGKTDGLESTQCNGMGQPAGCKTRDGRLWFPTSKGLVTVDPATIKVNTLPPPVYIEQIMADRKPVRSDDLLTRHSSLITLSPGRGEVEFHYTALNLQAPESTRFKYMLEGVDSDWIDAGARRAAHYNNVYPGTYRFRVIACNKDGVWNQQGAELEIALRPHLWQTWWWRGSMALLVIGGASGTARYVTRKRMQRRLVLAEQRHAIEKERGRIAQDIHDDLGSSLTRIMMLGERAEDGLDKREEVGVHVHKIVASARHTVQALDEIVWAVNPENDTLEGLVEYISHYADELFENTSVSCRLEMPVELPPFTLSAETRHDLFLVVKEALNNIVKHARATEVSIQAAVSGTALEILIEDNGCGFDTNLTANSRHGNGLGNIRKRIQSLGGTLVLTSAPGKGTKLQLKTILSPERSPA
jgi:ligand-binding sensor domain-containing protein/signal transduction histidine kinase